MVTVGADGALEELSLVLAFGLSDLVLREQEGDEVVVCLTRNIGALCSGSDAAPTVA